MIGQSGKEKSILLRHVDCPGVNSDSPVFHAVLVLSMNLQASDTICHRWNP